MDADSLPFELTYFNLMIDVIDRPTGVLKHVLGSLLHDRARKCLDAGLVGCLSLRIRRNLPGARLGLAWRLGLVGGRLRLLLALLRVRGGLLGVEQPAPRDDPGQQRERTKVQKKAEPCFHEKSSIKTGRIFRSHKAIPLPKEFVHRAVCGRSKAEERCVRRGCPRCRPPPRENRLSFFRIYSRHRTKFTRYRKGENHKRAELARDLGQFGNSAAASQHGIESALTGWRMRSRSAIRGRPE
jgi:hypothetical protein